MLTRFKDGYRSVKDDPRSRGYSTSTDNIHVQKIKKPVRVNLRLAVRELAEIVGILVGSSFDGKILRLMIKQQEENLVDVCLQLLELAKDNERQEFGLWLQHCDLS